jgi:hypothetical protein
MRVLAPLSESLVIFPDTRFGTLEQRRWGPFRSHS